MDIVKDAIGKLRGAVMIVYPMGLPPYDPIKQELENTEDLSGTQVHYTGQPRDKSTIEVYKTTCKQSCYYYFRVRSKFWTVKQVSYGGQERNCIIQKN